MLTIRAIPFLLRDSCQSTTYKGSCELNLPHFGPFLSDSEDVDVHSSHLLLDHIEFTFIHGPNIPGPYGISLEGMMLKLKLQYFGHLMQRVDSLEKTDAGRNWGQEEKGTTEDEMAGWHH